MTFYKIQNIIKSTTAQNEFYQKDIQAIVLIKPPLDNKRITVLNLNFKNNTIMSWKVCISKAIISRFIESQYCLKRRCSTAQTG